MQQNQGDAGIQSFFQAMQFMDGLYEEYARKNGLTYMSLYILETIYDQKGCTQKRISEITLYPKQSVNMVIRSFLEKGWVALERDAKDRRSKYVRLTPAGEAFAESVVEPYWKAGSSAFDALGAQERSIMLRALQSFIDAFAEKIKEL